jgi:hypothetical protein
MAWSIRKSLRLLPGVRVNISKSGPRLSIGVPGARASIGTDGKARIYGGVGPLRYQKRVSLTGSAEKREDGSLLDRILRSMRGT